MIRIDKIIPGGQALGKMEDGRKIFFWNALPGETIVSFEIIKKKTHYYEAIATKIDFPSSHRVEPRDDCFLSTSPWQIIDYPYELKLKQDLVIEFFREHQIDIERPEIITDNKDYHYRNKMEYSLYWDHKLGKILPSFHLRGSHRKIPILKSSIERPEIFAAAQEIIDQLNRNHEEARKYQSLLLRCNQKGEISGGLYENNKPHPKFNILTDQILGQSYSYSPNGFFQINLPVYELALKEIKKHINTEKVLDLYAGVGTIGLSVAPTSHLTLVESDKFAFSELAKNCKEAFFGGSLRQRAATKGQTPATAGWLPDASKRWPHAVLSKSENVLNYIESDQTVILDPPRSGCDKKLINKLLEVQPTTIIYLSCNPATQARDIKLLFEKYEIKTVKTFNFFPHTPHIENLVVLNVKTC